MTDNLRTTDFGFGWRPDTPDMRDLAYSAPLGVLQTLPPAADLRGQTPPIVNQGRLGSCTANAIGSAHYFDQMKQKAANPFQPSRLFIYYNERRMEDTIPSDGGAVIRDGCKSISNEGVCPEAMWPYDIAKYSDEPPKNCYDEALLHQSTQYMRIQQSLGQLKGCLADGYPFVFGFTVYESFESPEVANTGIVPLPSNGENALGGHAVMAVGYNDSTLRFTVQNSWGDGWGDHGFFYLPYSYLIDTDLAADFWTIRLVEI